MDKVFVKINGSRHHLCRAVDHKGEVLKAVITRHQNKQAGLKFLKKLAECHSRHEEIVTNRVEGSHFPFR